MRVTNSILFLMTAIAFDLIGTLHLAIALANDGTEALSIETRPIKDTIFSGEPCAIELLLGNTRAVALTVNLGRGGTEALSFEIFDDARVQVCSPPTKDDRGGFSVIHRVTIEPMEVYRNKVVLNEWCTTLLPAGTYNAFCSLDLAGQRKLATCEFVVREVDSAALRAIFVDLAQTVLSLGSQKLQFFANRMLSYASSPLAVSALSDVVRGSPEFRRGAMERLALLRTPEAVLVLGAIITSNDPKLASSQAAARRLIGRISDETNDPEIRAICAPFILPAE